MTAYESVYNDIDNPVEVWWHIGSQIHSDDEGYEKQSVRPDCITSRTELPSSLAHHLCVAYKALDSGNATWHSKCKKFRSVSNSLHFTYSVSEVIGRANATETTYESVHNDIDESVLVYWKGRRFPTHAYERLLDYGSTTPPMKFALTSAKNDHGEHQVCVKYMGKDPTSTGPPGPLSDSITWIESCKTKRSPRLIRQHITYQVSDLVDYAPELVNNVSGLSKLLAGLRIGPRQDITSKTSVGPANEKVQILHSNDDAQSKTSKLSALDMLDHQASHVASCVLAGICSMLALFIFNKFCFQKSCHEVWEPMMH
eukprot:gnl/MRDRNA2_/MRDRNA2_63432_c0_seq1.p1 gnl/MRDRNA2_/MRDRNA2_63432_c0~~gnl/MRDRNA2_/MRDRNA2_63432_c0_seq1.p1  ORF type:complete len:313 (+),score=41.51 gnl/MRDRNA2_/MRDRNA2_63432_c0_seq1:109-1047(+)